MLQGAGPLIDRAPDSSRKEKRKRSKHDRPREEDDDGERRRRYRKKDDYSDGDSETKVLLDPEICNTLNTICLAVSLVANVLCSP